MTATSNYANSSNPLHSAEYLRNLAEMARQDEAALAEMARQDEAARRTE